MACSQPKIKIHSCNLPCNRHILLNCHLFHSCLNVATAYSLISMASFSRLNHRLPLKPTLEQNPTMK